MSSDVLTRGVVGNSADPQYSREATDEDRRQWIGWQERFNEEPHLLSRIEDEHPDIYEGILDELGGLAVRAQSDQWRNTRLGGRPEQLIPGTVGSFSDRNDWATWILMGGRGSGKSRTGAEAVREYALGRKWHIDQPYVALVGKRLDDVRVNMVENTLLPVLPKWTVRKWNRGSCELWLTNGMYMRGFSAESPENVRGPNLVFAWGDEFASWGDADRSPAAEHTTLSNLRMALREDDEETWTPRLILTTTPKPVRGLRNIDPSDTQNPGKGLVDMDSTVTSNMSTLANIKHLSPHFLETVVEPLRGTRLYEQEVEGHLLDLAVGALWSYELVEQMRRDDSYPERQAGGIVRTVVGVDPSINAGLGDECGIVVVGEGVDGKLYVLEDASVRAPAHVWSATVKKVARKWGAPAVIVEANQGGELVSDILGRDGRHFQIIEVHAKKGKRLRAEPVALMSDRGELLLAGEFERLEHQMKTFVGNDDTNEESPDRLDALCYGCLHLRPPRNMDTLVKMKRGRTRK